jgi:hypothetical protein
MRLSEELAGEERIAGRILPILTLLESEIARMALRRRRISFVLLPAIQRLGLASRNTGRLRR